MVEYQLVPTDRFKATAIQKDDEFEGMRVVASPESGPQLYVEVDSPAQLESMRRSGLIASYRPTKVYYPLVMDPFPTLETQILPLNIGDSANALMEDSVRILEAVRYGEGMDIWGLDTGLIAKHEFLEGKQYDGDLADNHGHGSFTISQMMSLLPKAFYHSIRVLGGPNGAGSEVEIINKLQQCRRDFQAMGSPRNSAANNSWGGGGSSGIDEEFKALHAANLWMTNAAGNSGSGATTPVTPTRVAKFVAGAYDRATDWLADFSSGGDSVSWVDGYWPGVNEWGIGIKLYNSYYQASGTSMADPYLTVMVACIRTLHPDWSDGQVESYLYEHFQALAKATHNNRGKGWLPVSVVPAAEQPGGSTDIDELVKQIRYERDVCIDYSNQARYVERERDPNWAWTLQGESTRILTDNLSPHIEELIGYLGKVEPPSPEPLPPPVARKLAMAYGTYGAQHGLAMDGYGGYNEEQVQWGPHHDIELIAHVDCVVSTYQFPTPLATYETMSIEDRTNAADLFRGWHCSSYGYYTQGHVWVKSEDVDGEDQLWVALEVNPLQSMYVAVMMFNQIVQGLRGGSLGHVRSDIRVGARKKGEVVAVSWDSGVRWEPRIDTRAAHTHFAAYAGTQLSPNGDVDGTALLRLMCETSTRLNFVPGPTHYQDGSYVAGRRREDFLAAKRPYPPIPA